MRSLVIAAIAIAISAPILLQILEDKEEGEFATFSSPQEFRSYLGAGGYLTGFARPLQMLSHPEPMPELEAISGKREIERVSQTNVQVHGIDEPDIVKTDGEKIFLSAYRWVPAFSGKMPPFYKQKTVVIKAFPLEELKKVGELNESGEMLLFENVLIILSGSKLSAFSTEDLKEKYSAELNGSILAVRLYGGKIYLILSQYSDTCPIVPLSVNGVSQVVECSRIYHPVKPLPVESIYTVLKLDAKSGGVEESISFVGNYASVVYMSKNAIYVAYYAPIDYSELMLRFASENRDLFPDWFLEKLKKLSSYELSEGAKQVEILDLLRRLKLGMEPEERIVFENEFNNRFEKYTERNARELERTIIWKISHDMKIVATGQVPGRLLNQFSMDEYEGYLRVATTVGNSNDLYVLNSQLRIIGSVKGFGETERIYAVRFIGDKGYIVTFRQTDPFFVVDLSDPKNPKIAGELKIPGFSSYLHPLGENMILGVGMEDGKVKLSLFDVSDPENPVEIDRYLLAESWSEVIGNHRAFLADEKHQIFFIPARSGYIFSYKDGLKLIKATESGFRALYIEDFFYIVGLKVVVFDERNWEKVAELELQS
jgi:inhibitor of cysteine peptidase